MTHQMPRPKLIEFDEYIAPDGLTYEFNDSQVRFLMSFSGFGIPPIEYRTQRGPFQDGETLIDFVLRPRVIQLLHRRGADSRDDYWDIREDLINHIRINRQTVAGNREQGVLRKRLSTGQVRDLNVLIESGPTFAPRNLNAWDERAFQEVLRFIAWDPTLFDPTGQSLVFTLTMADHLVFPVTIIDGAGEDMLFRAASVNETNTITYVGTWQTFPTIILTGPMQNPIIENQTTDETIELDYNLSADEIVTIDLAYGSKTVVNDLGTNLIGVVTAASDLATFHLAPDPEAPDGVNTIRVQFGGASGAANVALQWIVRYIGI